MQVISLWSQRPTPSTLATLTKISTPSISFQQVYWIENGFLSAYYKRGEEKIWVSYASDEEYLSLSEARKAAQQKKDEAILEGDKWWCGVLQTLSYRIKSRKTEIEILEEL